MVDIRDCSLHSRRYCAQVNPYQECQDTYQVSDQVKVSLDTHQDFDRERLDQVYQDIHQEYDQDCNQEHQDTHQGHGQEKAYLDTHRESDREKQYLDTHQVFDQG